ncbi:MAG: ATP-binding cassette domain-containing protein, partial [Dehalococcoidia bacterium]
TVRANLLWAHPAAGDADIASALQLAAADRVVAALPQGLETVLGDRGVRLSGGERQRLALARALLRRPSLLILDEATSNLDFEHERSIQRAIEKLQGQMTILVITHRLSTTERIDLIHVLDGGRVIESGTWDQLMANPHGRFRRMWTAEAPTAASGAPA